ncbi:MAG: sortase domain-containing protein [Candidatus Limnocylindria bacterium]
MKGSTAPGIVLPLVLAVVGVSLMLAGQAPVDKPGASLPGIPDQSEVAVATATPEASQSTGVPTPTGTPIPDSWVAVQIEVSSVALNVAVKHATVGQGDFPPDDAAYILYQSAEPGRGQNTYIIGHALQHLFKRLWNVVLGAEVRILMSDGTVLHYVVTEIHPNVSCPDKRSKPMPNPPLALQYAKPGCPGAAWANPTDHERLTLQTSQGFNRNWGELIIIAQPLF